MQKGIKETKTNKKNNTIMQKKHVSPEFTVIKQNEANAKFFVASFMGNRQGVTSTQVNQYGTETTDENSTVGGDGGFTF